MKLRDVPCLLYQGLYNLLRREPETEGILQQAKNNGVGYIAFSPLAQGLLTDRYRKGIPADSRMARNFFLRKEQMTPGLDAKIGKLSELASQRGQALAEMALAWILKDDLVTSVIVGTSSVDQLKININSIRNSYFSKEELQLIDNILEG
jgi:L-glyceraldehyde 3-phosphate reductase